MYVPSCVGPDYKGALPLSLAARTETDDVLVVTLPAAGAPKKVEGSPVPVGRCFIVEKKNAEKWPPKQHTSMVANAKFMVTWRFSSLFESFGLGIENPEAPRGSRLGGAESVMM